MCILVYSLASFISVFSLIFTKNFFSSLSTYSLVLITIRDRSGGRWAHEQKISVASHPKRYALSKYIQRALHYFIIVSFPLFLHPSCGDALIKTTPDLIKADGSSEKTPLTSWPIVTFNMLEKCETSLYEWMREWMSDAEKRIEIFHMLNSNWWNLLWQVNLFVHND